MTYDAGNSTHQGVKLMGMPDIDLATLRGSPGPGDLVVIGANVHNKRDNMKIVTQLVDRGNLEINCSGCDVQGLAAAVGGRQEFIISMLIAGHRAVQRRLDGLGQRLMDVEDTLAKLRAEMRLRWERDLYSDLQSVFATLDRAERLGHDAGRMFLDNNYVDLVRVASRYQQFAHDVYQDAQSIEACIDALEMVVASAQLFGQIHLATEDTEQLVKNAQALWKFVEKESTKFVSCVMGGAALRGLVGSDEAAIDAFLDTAERVDGVTPRARMTALLANQPIAPQSSTWSYLSLRDLRDEEAGQNPIVIEDSDLKNGRLLAVHCDQVYEFRSLHTRHNQVKLGQSGYLMKVEDDYYLLPQPMHRAPRDDAMACLLAFEGIVDSARRLLAEAHLVQANPDWQDQMVPVSRLQGSGPTGQLGQAPAPPALQATGPAAGDRTALPPEGDPARDDRPS